MNATAGKRECGEFNEVGIRKRAGGEMGGRLGAYNKTARAIALEKFACILEADI